MLAYKVKEECDGFKIRDGWYLVQHEIYTEQERREKKIPHCFLKEVCVDMTNTFFSFGCRFIKDDPDRKQGNGLVYSVHKGKGIVA